MDKFHFHPKKLVSSIVAIYVNLGQSGEFCKALPQDGRSFSIKLLEESAKIMRYSTCPSSWGLSYICSRCVTFFMHVV